MNQEDINPDQLYCAFGGGVGRFGTNFSVFSYQKTTIWIDVGAGFENRDYPGIQKILPNYELAELFPPDVVVLTHAHEDHIGSFSFFSSFIPKSTLVVTSPFTHALVKKRLLERGIKESQFEFRVIRSNESLNVNEIELSFFFMPHSILHAFSVGVHIKPLSQKLYFSSDFKIKGIEPRFNAEDIKNYGPVQFLFCDSTGSLLSGTTLEESQIVHNLEEAIKKCEGRVFITTFASHIERLKGIFRIGEKHQRTVSIMGQSLKVYLTAALSVREFSIPIEQIRKPSNKNEKVLMIVSGCQANVGSSLYRLARDELSEIKLKPGDTLIYSSSIIPGNEEGVFYALNRISEKGVRVMGLNKNEAPLHASGHGKREDILELISWLKPQKVVPVHGDPLHFHNFYDFLEASRVRIVKSNSVYRIDSSVPDEYDIKEAFPLEVRLGFMEGAEIHHDTQIFYKRQNLGKDGICNIIVNESSLKLLKVNYVGVTSERLLNSHKKQIIQEVEQQIKKIYGGETKNVNQERKLKEKIFKMNQYYFKKKPYVNVIFI